jgi:hypothetical protein
MSNYKYFIVIAFVVAIFLQGVCFALEGQYLFRDIEENEELKTFIKLHQRAITGDPDLDITQQARFAIGEYFFKHNDLYSSRKIFRQYAQDYPPQISTLIAKIFLFKIAKLQNDTDAEEKLKKEIFGESFVILFSDYKVLKYTSVFKNNYTVNFYINKVEVFLNGELFEKIDLEIKS